MLEFAFDLRDPLLNWRQKGWDRYQELGLPLPKQEAFQYVARKWEFPPAAQRKTLSREPIQGLVFADGFFEETFSQVEKPLICLPLDGAVRSYGLFLQSRLTKFLKEESDPFALLNCAFQGRGAFLYIPPKCKAALHLLHIWTDAEMASPRLHIYLGRGAELHLKQTSVGKSGFSNAFIDCVLDEGAHFTLIDEADGDLQALRATLKRDSQMKAVFLGTKLRNSLRVQLAEENSQVELLGLSRLQNKEEAHIHATVEHIAPHTHSRQHFKSVVRDHSRFSFEGKIAVRPEAQKTEAYQLNNNLILSDTASANAKPNLEVFADDVKASHGATVGQLDDEQLFYLRSRGLSLAQAREWLIAGFCKEILDHAR